jgi:hypothetical protein
LAGFAAAGIEEVMVMPIGPDPAPIAEGLVTEVLPRVAGS